ncbi:MAG: hypothetical protein E7131_00490 [Rikenellaceae bacterium]|nr:hypothetical protein [Rikenellaceae bacterium]
MKRFTFFTALMVLMVALLGVACGDPKPEEPKTIAVTGVTLSPASKVLAPGDSVQLTATVAPEDADDKSVVWSSSKESVATVSDEGLVSAVSEGSATITVKTVDGEKTATCKITVESVPAAVEGVAINKQEIELAPGQTEQLEAIISPENAENKDVRWLSSNYDVANVGRTTGLVTAKANGEATITVKTVDGEKTATCVVKVITPIESISLSSTSATLIPEATLTLVATVLPETASNKNYSWSSSNEAVAKVEDGVVTAVAVGEATISATTEAGGKAATCKIVVAEPTTQIKAISFNITVSQNDATNSWSQRRDAIVKFIEAENPDVIGMQEVTGHQLSYLKDALLGYDHYGVDRGGSNNGFERTSIMYNKQTVEVLDKGTFWLSPTPDTPSKSWSDATTTQLELYYGGKDSQKYHRPCTWIKFKCKSDNKVFFYYNTHLEYGYHAMLGEYPQELGLMGQTAREKGVALIVERIKQQAVNGEVVIFGGDMNQVANDKCFNAAWEYGMKSGRATAESVLSEQNRNSITWNDYDASAHDKEDKNNYSPNSWNMIDHFFLKNCNAVEFRTIRDTNYGGELKGKDNGSYMADHFPILMVFEM